MEEPSTTLSVEQLARRLFSSDPSEASTNELRAIAELVSDEPVYLTGSNDTQGVMASARAAYVQGSDGFLKIQVLPVGRDARQLRARAVGNSATIVQNATWVFLHDDEGLREIEPSRDTGSPRWMFESSGGEVVVVSCYPYARSCVGGKELVWVESEEWARRIRELDVYFGGSVSSLHCEQAYAARRWEGELVFVELDDFEVVHMETDRVVAIFQQVVQECLQAKEKNGTRSHPSWRLAERIWAGFDPTGEWLRLSVRDLEGSAVFLIHGERIEASPTLARAR